MDVNGALNWVWVLMHEGHGHSAPWEEPDISFVASLEFPEGPSPWLLANRLSHDTRLTEAEKEVL